MIISPPQVLLHSIKFVSWALKSPDLKRRKSEQSKKKFVDRRVNWTNKTNWNSKVPIVTYLDWIAMRSLLLLLLLLYPKGEITILLIIMIINSKWTTHFDRPSTFLLSIKIVINWKIFSAIEWFCEIVANLCTRWSIILIFYSYLGLVLFFVPLSSIHLRLQTPWPSITSL